MSALVKRYFPTLLLASLAFFIVGDTLLLDPTLNNYAASVRAAQGIIGSFAVILSVTLMSRLHVRRIQRRTRTIESSVLLICMWATISWGLFRLFVNGVSPTVEPTIINIFNAIVSPGDSTIYAILAFFIASAAYRAFRARSVEATILLVAGVIVMLGQAPIGESIFGWIPGMSSWVLNVANKASSRVIILSSIIATAALYMRIILGYERGWMGRGD